MQTTVLVVPDHASVIHQRNFIPEAEDVPILLLRLRIHDLEAALVENLCRGFRNAYSKAGANEGTGDRKVVTPHACGGVENLLHLRTSRRPGRYCTWEEEGGLARDLWSVGDDLSPGGRTENVYFTRGEN